MKTHSCVSIGLHMCVWYAGADNVHQVGKNLSSRREGLGLFRPEFPLNY